MAGKEGKCLWGIMVSASPRFSGYIVSYKGHCRMARCELEFHDSEVRELVEELVQKMRKRQAKDNINWITAGAILNPYWTGSVSNIISSIRKPASKSMSSFFRKRMRSIYEL